MPLFKQDSCGGDSLADSVAYLVREEYRKMLEAQKSPEVSGEEKIHALRLHIKFLRSMLRLLKPLWKKNYQKENRRLRDLGRKFARSRDETVATSWIRKFLKKQPTPSLKTALENALQGFSKPVEDFQKPTDEVEGCLRVFQEVGCRFQKLSENGITGKWLKKRLEKGYARARKDMRRLQDGSNARYHSWRKSSKAFYFQLDLFQKLGAMGKGRDFLGKGIHKLQARLGDQHDLVMIRSLLEKTPARFGGKKSVKIVSRFLTQKLKSFRKKCRKKGGRIFKPEKLTSMRRESPVTGCQ